MQSCFKNIRDKVVATPEEILKEKIKRRKKEYFSILTKLQADFPALFSEEPRPMTLGIDIELKGRASVLQFRVNSL